MLDDGVIEARTPSNYGDEMLSTTCTFHVAKGEERPEIGKVGPVVGVANKHCNWDVPFQVISRNKPWNSNQGNLICVLDVGGWNSTK